MVEHSTINARVVSSNLTEGTINFTFMGEKKTDKILKSLRSDTISKLVTGVNDLSIKKEDIVDIITIPNGYVLLYYGV